MGDDHERAAAAGEVAREPVHALDVEVVRRLVEQEQRRAVEQQAGQGDAAALAAAQAADAGGHPLGQPSQLDAAEQAVEHLAEAAVAGPLVLGAVADQLVAHRALRVEVVALPDEGEVDVA